VKKTELQSKSLKTLTSIALKLGIKKPSIRVKEDLIAEILTAEKVANFKAAKARSVVKKSSPAAKASVSAEKEKKSSAISSRGSKASAEPTPSSKRRRTSAKNGAGSKANAPTSQESVEADDQAHVAHKFELPSHPQPAVPASQTSPFDHLGEIPQAYGTGKLFLAARDPHWIYCYWDFTHDQMNDMRRHAQHGELKLKIFAGRDSSAPLNQELVLAHGAQNWYVHTNHPNCDFCAEFGYYNDRGEFHVASRSNVTRAPSDRVSDRTEARFVTIPFHIKFRDLYELVKAYFKDGEELADVLHRLQAAGFKFPFDYEGVESGGADGKLEDMFDLELMRKIRMGSDEITEWLRRRLREETSSGMFSLSSPMGASFGKRRGFWFNVNAELIVYGETEPDARVVVDGREIRLAPNGTFRFHFALPDGLYHIPMSATSADGQDTRKADLSFERTTQKEGVVGAVPHPSDLAQPPHSRSGRTHKSAVPE
jgi:uncharacterized protein